MKSLKFPTTITEIAKFCKGKIHGKGDPQKIINGFATLETATNNDISFLYTATYLKQFKATQAAVVITTNEYQDEREGLSIIVDGNPRNNFAKLVNATNLGRQFKRGIDKSAKIAKNTKIGKDVHIAAGVVIGENVVIGDYSKILANVVITEGTTIGKNAFLHESCVIGAEGFGMIKDKGKNIRFNHIGKVVLEDFVEVGANSCIDRGVLGDTLIKNNVKIDNLVQIAHNVVIGKNSIVCGHVAIGGSTQIGDNCTIGGGCRIKDNCFITDNVSLLGATVVLGNIRKAGIYGSALPQITQNSLKNIWKLWFKQSLFKG